jgi:ABC-type uncharacterized transport system substrate-binding protein
MGLVARVALPDGNMTGVNFFAGELAAKRLELLRDLVPGAIRVAALFNPANPNMEVVARDAEAAAGAMGLQMQVTSTDSKKSCRQETQLFPSSEKPPPGSTIMGTCGWWVRAEPQVDGPFDDASVAAP